MVISLFRSLHIQSGNKVSTPIMSSSGQICRQFSLDEIKSATSNFDDELIIGIEDRSTMMKRLWHKD
ncbi:hypothetical protein Leryth_007045 [Lithospermum erythrorhizon]|nr:hypothetical protein Leryth_007045 [Lithospermum erythrorhizon]